MWEYGACQTPAVGGEPGAASQDGSQWVEGWRAGGPAGAWAMRSDTVKGPDQGCGWIRHGYSRILQGWQFIN